MKPGHQPKLNTKRGRYSEQNGRSCESDGSSSSELSKKKNNKVIFYDKVQGREIRSHRNFSKEEHQNTWITDEDSKGSQLYITNTVRIVRKKIRHGQPIPSCINDNEDLCVRGLEEMHTSQSGQIVENRRVAVRCAVFKEQRRQRQRDKPDPRRIARASMANSSDSMDIAISQAAKDAAYVNLHVRARPSARRSMDHIHQQRPSREHRPQLEPQLSGFMGLGEVERHRPPPPDEYGRLNDDFEDEEEEPLIPHAFGSPYVSPWERAMQNSSPQAGAPAAPPDSDVGIDEIQVAFQNANISGIGEEEEQSNRSLLSSPTNLSQPRRRRDSSLTTLEQSELSIHSSPTNPNQARRRDSSLTTLDQSNQSLLSSPTNPNQPRRRDSSLTTLGQQGGNESEGVIINNVSSLITNPNEQSLRSVESTAIATDSASTFGSRRSIESRTLIRQGRGLYRPRKDQNERSPHM